MSASLSVVVVTHGHAADIGRTLAALRAELGPGDEVVVVDNASPDGTVEAVRRADPEARVVEAGGNLGFPAACNLGAERARGDLLVLLNPDAVVQPGFGAAIRRPLDDGRGWAAWMALVTMDGGALVNTSGGVLHFTGIAWAGQAGAPLAAAPAGPAEVAFLSGACLAIPRAAWEEAGGMPAEYFLYHEDVDLSLRLRLAGGRIGVEPAARVEHDYDFHKGAAKWRHLERNRWATIVRTYPPGLLAVLAPALVATELALVAVSVAGGWWRQKLLAWADVVRALPRLAGERRAIQARRTIGSREFARRLTPDLDSAYLGAPARSRVVRACLSAYWAAALAVLERRPGPS